MISIASKYPHIAKAIKKSNYGPDYNNSVHNEMKLIDELKSKLSNIKIAGNYPRALTTLGIQNNNDGEDTIECNAAIVSEHKKVNIKKMNKQISNEQLPAIVDGYSLEIVVKYKNKEKRIKLPLVATEYGISNPIDDLDVLYDEANFKHSKIEQIQIHQSEIATLIQEVLVSSMVKNNKQLTTQYLSM